MLYVPYGSILIALLLVHLPRAIVGAEMKKLAGGYDNSDPRGQQAKLEGRGKRALGAHQNGFEAFAPFAIGVLCCVQVGASSNLVAIACLVFVAARVAYIAAYIADTSVLRSGMWTLGMLATGALYISALLKLP